MLIKRVILNNIRSYVHETINFPNGKVLLSGDIGSGKSTILLAIEFALFGLMRNNLNGNTLLRNGTDSGSVELHLEINKNKIIINRKLKRSNKSIIQDNGHIIINGETKVGTATELKQKILELLNYPHELLTKNKSLIYRYTIYTPQEQMKHILFCDHDERLEILRRIFDIDKYKRINDNVKIISNYLREEKKYLKGTTTDLDLKIELFKNNENEIKEYEQKIEKIKPEQEKTENQVKELVNKRNEIEDKIKELTSIENELKILNNNLKNKLDYKKDLVTEINEINDKIIKEPIKKLKPIENYENTKKELNKQKNELNEKIREIITKISYFQTLNLTANNIKKEIYDLNFCPTCKQEVSSNHKDLVFEKENKKILENSQKIELYKQEQEKIQSRLQEINNLIENTDKIKQEIEIENLKQKRINEMHERLIKLNEEHEKTKTEIGKYNLEINEKYKQLEQMEIIKKNYENLKNELNKAESSLNQIQFKNQELKIKLDHLKQNSINLNKEIELKRNNYKKLQKYDHLYDWLNKHFTELISTIEKNILLKVHSEFNSYLEKWFSILVNEDDFSINLNETFSINIEQNGYKLDYENLSGGEKTAAALAYRLALNQVINNLVNTINTKNLIILDEPTDGFSNKQLDNMHLLLNEINASQIILVSHEKKIEHLVDNVINFIKKEHISSAYY